MSSHFDKRWEDAVYAMGKQHNRWPNDSFIPTFFGAFGSTSARSSVKVLELGCGVGNNLWFFAKEGFDATGIDGSSSAVEAARTRIEREGLKAELIVGDFSKLDFKDATFDFVLDRGSINHNNRAGIKCAFGEAARVLKPGGILFTQMLSTDCYDMRLGIPNGDGSFHSFRGGYFELVGTTFFVTPKDVRGWLESDFDLLSLWSEIHRDELTPDRVGVVNASAKRKS